MKYFPYDASSDKLDYSGFDRSGVILHIENMQSNIVKLKHLTISCLWRRNMDVVTVSYLSSHTLIQ